jgi:hypothetical protein
MKNKINLFLAPYGLRNKFYNLKKYGTRTRILKKISPKNIPSGSEIWDPENTLFIPDPGGKKAPDPDP